MYLILVKLKLEYSCLLLNIRAKKGQQYFNSMMMYEFELYYV